jgi:class 3 adenylate cyclase
MAELKRQISVILSADIVCYTLMMEISEHEALAKIKRYQDAINHEAGKQNGDIVKTSGNGCIILFISALHALCCTISVQKSLLLQPVVPLRPNLFP